MNPKRDLMRRCFLLFLDPKKLTFDLEISREIMISITKFLKNTLSKSGRSLVYLTMTPIPEKKNAEMNIRTYPFLVLS